MTLILDLLAKRIGAIPAIGPHLIYLTPLEFPDGFASLSR
jgi:hypothetical protein